MWILLLLAIGVVAVPCTRERILECVTAWLDTNYDGEISVYELNNYTVYKPCGPSQRGLSAGAYVMEACDMNGDGVLTEADYDSPASCTRAQPLRDMICARCDECEQYNAV